MSCIPICLKNFRRHDLCGGVTQQNVFGSGNHLGVQVNTSKINTVYSLSFTQPYWTVDGVSRGFDLYQRNVDPSSLSLGQYRTSTLGGQARIGVPFTDIDTVSFGLGYEQTGITTYPDSPLRIVTYVNTFGTDNTALLGNVGWARDTRDSAIYPTSGATSLAFVETGLPGGTPRFYKQCAASEILSVDATLRLPNTTWLRHGWRCRRRSSAGIMSEASLRCAAFTLQPSAEGCHRSIGEKKVVGSAELLFPFPGLRNDKSVRVSAFVDAGVAGESYAFSELRAAAGLAVLWVSPFGPIKLSAAEPFRSQIGDKKQSFQFTFGSQF